MSEDTDLKKVLATHFRLSQPVAPCRVGSAGTTSAQGIDAGARQFTVRLFQQLPGRYPECGGCDRPGCGGS